MRAPSAAEPRQYAVSGARLVWQCLCPDAGAAVYYVYIPYRDQIRLPNFDSSDMDFNFAQLFTDNQFAGSDRINNANQLTAALTSGVLERHR